MSTTDFPIPLPPLPFTGGGGGGGGTRYDPATKMPVVAPPIPHIGNPIPYVVHGAEAAWSDVYDWTTSTFHKALGFLGNAAGVTFKDVENIVDAGLSVSQTAWASFTVTLEGWITQTFDAVIGAIGDLGTLTLTEVLDVYNTIAKVENDVLTWTYDGWVAIDQRFNRQWWDTVTSIDAMAANLRTWSIDNIYNPLVADVFTSIGAVEGVINADVRALEREISGVRDIDIPKILASLGIITAAITALQSWVDDCGEPMCQTVGPKTDFSKLLKVLDIAGLLALVTGIGTLTESEIEQIAATVVKIGADPSAAFVDAFVTQGDTLATAIADTFPALA